MQLLKLFPIVLSFLISNLALSMTLPQDTDNHASIVLKQPTDEAGWNKLAAFWQSVETFVHEKILFISEFWRNRHQVGSLFPSSKYLARAMTKDIKYYDWHKSLSILEVGAGTGIFTKYIIKYILRNSIQADMDVTSDFDVVEIDPLFCAVLIKEFGQIPDVHFLCCDITKFETKKQYDFIISGLPFHSFDPKLVRQILGMYTKLIKPGGTVTFFEYIAIQTLKKPFLSDKEQETLETIRELIEIFKKLGKSSTESIVWRNFLPARVISVTF